MSESLNHLLDRLRNNDWLYEWVMESFTWLIQEQLNYFMSESLNHLLDGFVQNSAVKINTLTQALNIFSLMGYKYLTQGRARVGHPTLNCTFPHKYCIYLVAERLYEHIK